ncbi:MAG: pilin [Patescibacteria group bacterium]|nr:pilin [Patescibacteria group bacterium]
MNKKFLKQAISCVMLMFMAFSMFTVVSLSPVNAEAADPWGDADTKQAIEDEIGLGTEDPRIMVGKIINVIVGFLGIIAVIIILLGGFKWMTAGGNEEKTTEALTLIRSGVIGLIIVLATWAIAKFVVDLLYNATKV